MAKKKLVEVIREFQGDKTKLIPFLILLGLVGLVLPIIPGIALIALALSLFFPRKK